MTNLVSRFGRLLPFRSLHPRHRHHIPGNLEALTALRDSILYDDAAREVSRKQQDKIMGREAVLIPMLGCIPQARCCYCHSFARTSKTSRNSLRCSSSSISSFSQPSSISCSPRARVLEEQELTRDEPFLPRYPPHNEHDGTLICPALSAQAVAEALVQLTTAWCLSCPRGCRRVPESFGPFTDRPGSPIV